jgi:hypothetical protein
MDKLLKFCQFFDNNKKMYINGNTGRGKTLGASLFALFFLETHPEFKVIANYILNIYSKKTKKSMCEFTKFGLLPFSKLTEGNYLLIIDDFKAVKRYLKNFGSILAIMSRKLNIYCLITLHYYTHLIKENREMFNQEITLEISKLVYNPIKHQTELSNDSKLRISFFETNSLELTNTETFSNVLNFVKGNYSLENVYVKGLLYNTYGMVYIPNPDNIMREISDFSNDLESLRDNVNLFTSNERQYKSIVRKIALEKGFV